jgi:hypothetical protein
MSTSENAYALPTLDGTDGAITIRKWVSSIEDVLSDGQRATERPIRRAVIGAVISNPYAGRWSDDLELLERAGEVLATSRAASRSCRASRSAAARAPRSTSRCTTRPRC